jgi:hypothetical protein
MRHINKLTLCLCLSLNSYGNPVFFTWGQAQVAQAHTGPNKSVKQEPQSPPNLLLAEIRHRAQANTINKTQKIDELEKKQHDISQQAKKSMGSVLNAKGTTQDTFPTFADDEHDSIKNQFYSYLTTLFNIKENDHVRDITTIELPISKSDGALSGKKKRFTMQADPNNKQIIENFLKDLFNKKKPMTSIDLLKQYTILISFNLPEPLDKNDPLPIPESLEADYKRAKENQQNAENQIKNTNRQIEQANIGLNTAFMDPNGTLYTIPEAYHVEAGLGALHDYSLLINTNKFGDDPEFTESLENYKNKLKEKGLLRTDGSIRLTFTLAIDHSHNVANPLHKASS